jgi:hypothetical protein
MHIEMPYHRLVHYFQHEVMLKTESKSDRWTLCYRVVSGEITNWCTHHGFPIQELIVFHPRDMSLDSPGWQGKIVFDDAATDEFITLFKLKWS